MIQTIAPLPDLLVCPKCGNVDRATACRFCGISKLKPYEPSPVVDVPMVIDKDFESDLGCVKVGFRGRMLAQDLRIVAVIAPPALPPVEDVPPTSAIAPPWAAACPATPSELSLPVMSVVVIAAAVNVPDSVIPPVRAVVPVTDRLPVTEISEPNVMASFGRKAPPAEFAISVIRS